MAELLDAFLVPQACDAFETSEADKLEGDARWKYGTPPQGNANFAWVQHMLHHLAPNGSMALLLATARPPEARAPSLRPVSDNRGLHAKTPKSPTAAAAPKPASGSYSLPRVLEPREQLLGLDWLCPPVALCKRRRHLNPVGLPFALLHAGLRELAVVRDAARGLGLCAEGKQQIHGVRANQGRKGVSP